jgi:tetratricopeptide (TPR) repeat protein
VRAREHLINAAQMDPQLADAQTGLGLYNYYVDTLSAMARVLRFFMGIPGGSRKEGTLQLERAMASGHLTQAEARFYLAKNLRNYEQRYDRSVALLQPLVAQYPRNPVFHLLLGDFHAKLGHASEAAASYRTALALAAAPPAAAAGSPSPRDTPCAARIRALATQALAALASKDKK